MPKMVNFGEFLKKTEVCSQTVLTDRKFKCDNFQTLYCILKTLFLSKKEVDAALITLFKNQTQVEVNN